MRRILGVAVLVVLVGAACGGGDDSAQPYVRAAASDLRAESDALDRAQATCIATATVDAVGVDALEEAGVDPEEFAEADSYTDLGLEPDRAAIDQLGRDLDACDLREIVVSSFAEAVGGLSDDAVVCVQEGIDDEAWEAALAEDTLSAEGTAVANEILAGFTACPDAVAEVLVAGTDIEGAAVSSEAAKCVADGMRAQLPLGEDADFSDDASDIFFEAAIACPDLMAELVVIGIEQDLGVEVPREGAACIAEQFRARPEEVARAILEDGPESDALRETIRLACGEFLGAEPQVDVDLRTAASPAEIF